MCVIVEVEVDVDVEVEAVFVMYQLHFLNMHFAKALITVDILINHVHFDKILSVLRLKSTLILCIFSCAFCILSIF